MTYQQRILRILPKVRYYIGEFQQFQSPLDEGEEAVNYRYSLMRWMDLECRLLNRLNGIPRPLR